jgi:hypothetical protein
MTALVTAVVFMTYHAVIRETWKLRKPSVIDPRPCRI